MRHVAHPSQFISDIYFDLNEETNASDKDLKFQILHAGNTIHWHQYFGVINKLFLMRLASVLHCRRLNLSNLLGSVSSFGLCCGDLEIHALQILHTA